jgi:hypothetical protein
MGEQFVIRLLARNRRGTVMIAPFRVGSKHLNKYFRTMQFVFDVPVLRSRNSFKPQARQSVAGKFTQTSTISQ